MALSLNGTSGISGIDGSAGTPALQGSDTNTGISFGADTVNINTGGTTRATVDSSGRVLVGTSSSRQANGGLQVESTAGNSFVTITRNDSAANAPQLNLQKSRGTANGQFTLVSSGDQLGQINFKGSDGSADVTAASVIAEVDGTPGANDMPGRIVFSTTADGASSPTERMRIKSNGEIYVNTTTQPGDAASYVGIVNAGQSNYAIAIKNSNTLLDDAIGFFNSSGTRVGYISFTTTATSYNTSSDYRLKENVVDLDGAIARVKQLAPKRFNFIDDAETTVDGFLAHEAQAVVPEAVTGTHNEVDDEGNPIYQGIDQSKLVPLLTAALQEAIAKIESLETRLTALEGGINP